VWEQLLPSPRLKNWWNLIRKTVWALLGDSGLCNQKPMGVGWRLLYVEQEADWIFPLLAKA
jgi:hypothetical protein